MEDGKWEMENALSICILEQIQMQTHIQIQSQSQSQMQRKFKFKVKVKCKCKCKCKCKIANANANAKLQMQHCKCKPAIEKLKVDRYIPAVARVSRQVVVSTRLCNCCHSGLNKDKKKCCATVKQQMNKYPAAHFTRTKQTKTKHKTRCHMSCPLFSRRLTTHPG